LIIACPGCLCSATIVQGARAADVLDAKNCRAARAELALVEKATHHIARPVLAGIIEHDHKAIAHGSGVEQTLQSDFCFFVTVIDRHDDERFHAFTF